MEKERLEKDIDLVETERDSLRNVVYLLFNQVEELESDLEQINKVAADTFDSRIERPHKTFELLQETKILCRKSLSKLDSIGESD
jgi:hypothetical protein